MNIFTAYFRKYIQFLDFSLCKKVYENLFNGIEEYLRILVNVLFVNCKQWNLKRKKNSFAPEKNFTSL